MKPICDSHFGEETLERYALGRLSDELMAPFEEHILLCENCLDRLEQVELYVKVSATAAGELRAEGRQPVRRGVDLSWLWRIPKPVWAGALAAAVLSIVIPIYRENGQVTSTEVLLQSSRGVEKSLVSHAKPGRLVLNIPTGELPSYPSYRVELVNTNGDEIWQGATQATGPQLRVPVPKTLGEGSYWVRIYAPNGSGPLRESGLQVR